MKATDKKPSARPRMIRHGTPVIARLQEANVQRQQIGQIIRNKTIQTKLTIGAANDKYEQEADHVADQIMRAPQEVPLGCMPDPLVQRRDETAEEEEEAIQTKPLAEGITPLIQRQTEPVEEEEETDPEREEEAIQTKPLTEGITPLIQRQAEPAEGEEEAESEREEEEPIQTKPLSENITTLIQRQVETAEEETEPEKEEEPLQEKSISNKPIHVVLGLQSHIQTLKGGGQPLPETERAFFEPRFGVDFSQVRTHTDPNASDTARSINARAFTFGNNIVFGAGQYQPHAHEGRRLIAHELAHVRQQCGWQPYIQRQTISPIESGDVQLPSDVPDETTAASEREYIPPKGVRVAEVVEYGRRYRLWGFRVGSSDLLDDHFELLRDLAELLSIEPLATVTLVGHASRSGTYDLNDYLSRDRAESVTDELARLGVDIGRLQNRWKSFGEPLISNSGDPAAMARNRRVEITVAMPLQPELPKPLKRVTSRVWYSASTRAPGFDTSGAEGAAIGELINQIIDSESKGGSDSRTYQEYPPDYVVNRVHIEEIVDEHLYTPPITTTQYRTAIRYEWGPRTPMVVVHKTYIFISKFNKKKTKTSTNTYSRSVIWKRVTAPNQKTL